MNFKVRSLKLPIKTGSFVEVIITSSNEVFDDFKSNMAIGIRKLGILTQETAERNDTITQTVGS
jgi:hypothetical protein